MAFQVEDGTGLADSNSYGAVADADAYFLDRGNTVWSALTNDRKQQCLIAATDYIDARFGSLIAGSKVEEDQALVFPTDAFDGVPANVKKAAYEYAVRASEGPLAPDLESHASGYQVSRAFEKVGPIEERTDFAIMGPGATRQVWQSYPSVDALLVPFFRSNNGGRVIRN